MKSFHNTILLLLLPTILIGQNPAGKYFDNSDYLEFERENIRLEIESNGGLIISLCASGIFEICDNFLLINAHEFDDKKSIIETEHTNSDYSLITISDQYGNHIPGVQIILIDRTDKILKGFITDLDGNVSFESNAIIDKVRVAYIGYDELLIEFSNKLNYNIKLVDYDVLENQTIVFKINSYNSDTLNLTLLTTLFKYTNDKQKALKKLDKAARKYKYRERLFIK